MRQQRRPFSAFTSSPRRLGRFHDHDEPHAHALDRRRFHRRNGRLARGRRALDLRAAIAGRLGLLHRRFLHRRRLRRAARRLAEQPRLLRTTALARARSLAEQPQAATPTSPADADTTNTGSGKPLAAKTYSSSMPHRSSTSPTTDGASVVNSQRYAIRATWRINPAAAGRSKNAVDYSKPYAVRVFCNFTSSGLLERRHRQTHFAGVAAEHLHRRLERDRVARQAEHVAAEREQLRDGPSWRRSTSPSSQAFSSLSMSPRHNVADDRDHAAAADREQRQRQAVVPDKIRQVGGRRRSATPDRGCRSLPSPSECSSVRRGE